MIFIWHNYFLSGIIVFLSFFLIFWATIEKFVNENDQLFPKLSNFVSILFCLSIYNETVEHLCSIIGATKSMLRNSCCSHGRGNTLVLKKGRQRSKRQNLSMRNLSTKILSTRILSTTEFWALEQRTEAKPFVNKNEGEEGHEKGEE